MLQYMPLYGWLGVITLILFHVAAIIMAIARKKRKPRLRKYHVWLAASALVLATIHGIWAISLYF